jgi:hypothetical protein
VIRSKEFLSKPGEIAARGATSSTEKKLFAAQIVTDYGLRLDATSAAMMITPSNTPASRPAMNCHIRSGSASRNQDGCQPLDVLGRHIRKP